MKSGIYQIRRVDCDSMNYIGQGANVKKRMNAHGGKGENSYIDHAIRKHGRGAFVFEVLEYCEKDVLNNRERFWIAALDSRHPNGYNMTAGGGGIRGWKHTPEARRKIGESSRKTQRGKTPSKETKQKLREINLGKTLTEETKRKIGKSSRGRVHSEESKRKISETKREQKYMYLAMEEREKELLRKKRAYYKP